MEQRLIYSFDLRALRLLAKKTTVFMADLANVKTRKTYENWESESNSALPNTNQLYSMLVGCGYDAKIAFGLLVDRKSKKQKIDWNKALISSD